MTNRHGVPPVCPHLEGKRSGTWTSPDGSTTEIKESAWAHDHLIKTYGETLKPEQKRVLSAWEGLDQLYFFLLQKSGQKNIWAEIIGYIDRVSGAACGIEGVAGMTADEATRAALVRAKIDAGERKEPKRKTVERISAITGLMTLNALSIIQQERPELVQRITTELPDCDAVAAEYKADANQMLYDISHPTNATTTEPRLLDLAQDRVVNTLGRTQTGVINGLTKGVVRSMVKGLYKAMS